MSSDCNEYSSVIRTDMGVSSRLSKAFQASYIPLLSVSLIPMLQEHMPRALLASFCIISQAAWESLHSKTGRRKGESSIGFCLCSLMTCLTQNYP